MIGINKVFWGGFAETRHLVNIVNRSDIVEDMDEEDKLGQPMVAVGFEKDWGRLDFLSYLASESAIFRTGEAACVHHNPSMKMAPS